MSDEHATCTARLAVLSERVNHVAAQAEQTRASVAAMKATVIDHDRALVEMVGRDGHAGMLRQLSRSVESNTTTIAGTAELLSKTRDELGSVDTATKKTEWRWGLLIWGGAVIGSALVSAAINFIFKFK